MTAVGQAAIGAAAMSARGNADAAGAPSFCLFSKHVPDVAWKDLGPVVKDAGFDGVDLTVRAKGHVLPERAADDLPRAIEAITSRGSTVPMVTTDLTSARSPSARPLLEAAARAGVRYFKPGYWLYTPSGDVRAQVAAACADVEGLAALARDCGIQMGFHNHSAYIGAALWEIAPTMDRLDPRWAGYYFDPRHAVAEGGGGAWKAATRLVMPRLKMVALKDFFWRKTDTGWTIEDCPLGQGQVDWSWFAAKLREAQFSGPISLHLEYETGGSTPEERRRRAIDAARRDLAFARKMIA
jgi:sugar phosphate isomerase/epimerase